MLQDQRKNWRGEKNSHVEDAKGAGLIGIATVAREMSCGHEQEQYGPSGLNLMPKITLTLLESPSNFIGLFSSSRPW